MTRPALSQVSGGARGVVRLGQYMGKGGRLLGVSDGVAHIEMDEGGTVAIRQDWVSILGAETPKP